MSACESLEQCPFFNDHMANMPTTADLMKQRFCKGDNTNCARYMVFKALGKPKVPSDLFPSQIEIACEIIAKG